MLSKVRRLWRALTRRETFENDMDAEIRFHLHARAEDLERRGVAPADAARRARIDFGSIEKQKDLARDVAGVSLIDGLNGDVRYALRTLANNKTFTITAVLTLALGIGANASIFGLLEALILRSLPVHRPQDLLQITLVPRTSPDGAPAGSNPSMSYPLVRALDAEQEIFTGVAGFSDTSSLITTEGNQLARVPSAFVTGAFYETVGVQPVLGRLISRRDDEPGAPVVVVLSYAYWSRQFARDPSVVGRTLTINGVPAEIIGVSPKGFTGANVGRPADLSVPVASIHRLNSVAAGLLGPGNFWLRVLARVRAPLTPEAAAARVNAAWPQIAAQGINPAWPETRKQSILTLTAALTPGGTGWTILRERYTKPLEVLMAIVAVVLLIACANVASLLLARGSARRREFAIRLAIGAGRGRLIRQLLVESLLLSSTGAVAGMVLASVSSRFLVSVISTRRMDVALDMQPNWHVLTFAAGTAIGTALLFGLAPALQSTAAAPAAALKEDARAGSPRIGLLPSLVAVQVALCLILLIGAGLFVRTLRNLTSLDPGFRSAGVLLIGMERRPGAVPVSAVDELRTISGVVDAGVTTHTPLSGATWSDPAVPLGQRLPERDTAAFIGAEPGFFTTLQIGIIAGRSFTRQDTRESTPVAIVNERYAREYFPNGSPIGQQLTAVVRGEHRTLDIVGVARDINTGALRRAAPRTIYVPYRQLTGNVASTVVLRVNRPGAAIDAELRRVLQPLMPDPIEVIPLDSQVEATLVQERLMATLGSGFGVLALALASVGIYGLLACGVARRTREIGIRVALGARQRGVIALVLSSAWRPLAAGIVIGLPAAYLSTRWIESMLFGLRPSDPLTIGAAILGLAIVAHVAAWLPARRAARVDPLIALRTE